MEPACEPVSSSRETIDTFYEEVQGKVEHVVHDSRTYCVLQDTKRDVLRNLWNRFHVLVKENKEQLTETGKWLRTYSLLSPLLPKRHLLQTQKSILKKLKEKYQEKPTVASQP